MSVDGSRASQKVRSRSTGINGTPYHDCQRVLIGWDELFCQDFSPDPPDSSLFKFFRTIDSSVGIVSLLCSEARNCSEKALLFMRGSGFMFRIEITL
jgi:hypothetical protein